MKVSQIVFVYRSCLTQDTCHFFVIKKKKNLQRQRNTDKWVGKMLHGPSTRIFRGTTVMQLTVKITCHDLTEN